MPNNSTFSVAMSEDDGCIVMTRSNGRGKVTVIGALPREISLDFAAALINWKPKQPALVSVVDTAGQQKPIYPH